MQLHGIHHLTAVSADAPRNYDFYTRILGMRLVKKSVNQDDVSAYHLFYADAKASPGTDLTFFDWPVPPERRGTNSIVRTGLRVGSAQTLGWWKQRLDEHKVSAKPIQDRDGRSYLDFEDFEGQRLSLVVDPAGDEGAPWDRSPVPAEHQIRGLGPITLSVPNLASTEKVLTSVLDFEPARQYTGAASTGSGNVEYHVFTLPAGKGASAEIHVAVEPTLPPAGQGAGAVHHVALRTPNVEEYDGWFKRLQKLGIGSSGPVDRYYFRSLYFREPNGILFEIATDGPGFAVDEPIDKLGERLALPPFLESRRAEIERGLKPLESRAV